MARVGAALKSKNTFRGNLNLVHSFRINFRELLTKSSINNTSISSQHLRSIFERIIDSGPEFQHRISNEMPKM